eukprot:286339-Amphidinium_carterae.1
MAWDVHTGSNATHMQTNTSCLYHPRVAQLWFLQGTGNRIVAVIDTGAPTLHFGEPALECVLRVGNHLVSLLSNRPCLCANHQFSFQNSFVQFQRCPDSCFDR